jgi:hypothetical protein
MVADGPELSGSILLLKTFNQMKTSKQRSAAFYLMIGIQLESGRQSRQFSAILEHVSGFKAKDIRSERWYGRRRVILV